MSSSSREGLALVVESAMACAAAAAAALELWRESQPPLSRSSTDAQAVNVHPTLVGLLPNKENLSGSDYGLVFVINHAYLNYDSVRFYTNWD